MKREKTKYPGVFRANGIDRSTGKQITKYYIQYYRTKNDKRTRHMEKIEHSSLQSMTPAKANSIRIERIKGDPTNQEKREHEKQSKIETEAEKNKPTFDYILKYYIEDKKLNGGYKSETTDKGFYRKHLKALIGAKTPNQLIKFDIDRINRQLKKMELKDQTIKHILALVVRLAKWGFRHDICEPLNVVIEYPRLNNEKTEKLTPEQLRNLFGVLRSHHNKQAANLMLMVLYSGMRRSELFKLKWTDIDFENGFIFIRDPKGKKDQIIPLNDEARNLLKNHEKPFPDSEYIFPGKDGNKRVDIKKAVNSIKTIAGLPKDFRPIHGLRHVYASILANSGKVDMYTLQKLMTHKSPQMTQRYAHLQDDTLKKASNLIGELVRDDSSKSDIERESKSSQPEQKAK
jgi:integrase